MQCAHFIRIERTQEKQKQRSKQTITNGTISVWKESQSNILFNKWYNFCLEGVTETNKRAKKESEMCTLHQNRTYPRETETKVKTDNNKWYNFCLEGVTE